MESLPERTKVDAMKRRLLTAEDAACTFFLKRLFKSLGAAIAE